MALPSRSPRPRGRVPISYEIRRLRLPKTAAITLLGSAVLPLHGYDFLSPPSDAETAVFDRIWQGATLYNDDSNDLVQKFKLRGRYQGQYHQSDASQGYADGWEDRRSRFGFDAKMFSKTVDVRVDFQSNDGFEDVYDQLVDAYVKWKPDDSLTVTIGRTKPLIGYYDWLQSTNTQPTFERSQIFNQLRIDRATGLTIEGDKGQLGWQAGVYSNDTDREFGQFGGAFSFGAGVSYDAKDAFGWERADFRLDWLHSERDADDLVLNRYEDILSVTFWAEEGVWSFVAEGFFATGGLGADEDVLGGFVQGTYDLIENRLQLVGRYSFAHGDEPGSVRGQRRYESEVSAARGDSYHAAYLGTQYFIHGDQLKLMAGVEYASLNGGAHGDDFDGFTWLTGVRFSF